MHFLHSNTKYIDQSPDELRLTLIEGDLDRTQFQLLSEQERTFAGVKISAAVIGASHIVTFDTGTFKMHEIFACVGLDNVPFWGLPELTSSPVVREYPGFRYQFHTQQVLWSDPEPDVLIEMVREASAPSDSRSIRLVVNFPSLDPAVVPKTVVIVQLSPGDSEIVVRTAHSYPNVRGLVLSHSILNITRKGW